MTAQELELTDMIEEGEYWLFVRGVNSADQACQLAGALPETECRLVYHDLWAVAKEGTYHDQQ